MRARGECDAVRAGTVVLLVSRSVNMRRCMILEIFPGSDGGRQARLADRSAREDRWGISKFPLARTSEILNSTAQ
jgi:hypothetical protein